MIRVNHSLPFRRYNSLMQRAALPLLLLLAACAGEREPAAPSKSPPEKGSLVGETVSGVASGTYKAVQQPFVDVNLKREEIPPLLLETVKDPYRRPDPATCGHIRAEIAELDALLGTDPYILKPAEEKDTRNEYVEEGANLARDQAVDMVAGYLDVIPFRGVVRRVSGAEKHAKEVIRAYEAGKIRRAFLKGSTLQMNPECPLDQPNN